MRCWASYDKACVTVGADFIHVDNVDETTTKGTPQDMAMSVPEMLEEGQALLVWMSQLRQLRGAQGPTEVELVCTAGNHDRAFSYWLYAWAQAWYRSCERVVSATGPDGFLPRQYRAYGETLMLFTHGDGAKAKDLGKLMAQEARRMWGSTSRSVVFVGHRHFEMVQDHRGVQVYQTPSSSGTDAWHFNAGYVKSRKGLQMHTVDAEDGVVATVTGVA